MLRQCWQCSGTGTVLRYFRGWAEIDRAAYERLVARPDLGRSAQEPLAREFPCPRCRGAGEAEVIPDSSLTYLRPIG
jgi:hypothetical protein